MPLRIPPLLQLHAFFIGGNNYNAPCLNKENFAVKGVGWLSQPRWSDIRLAKGDFQGALRDDRDRKEMRQAGR